ncbi:DNA cytosine methyltransferase [Maridesulfovibrio sp.]|uniref:DNA cytosine methyltransferase n=1 Tax=Maridesulfovibrio sp. TaxID=2795000 RepID=UPI0029CA9559|nr:DNA cytosine methyltransferase [Maridesulfovibrio sp.]
MNGLALCAGGGGLEAGLSLVLPDQYRTVCVVERQAYAAASLVARMGKAGMDEAPVWDDVKTFDGKPWRGIVDIITGGYPCQPFSNAGECLAENDPRYIWPAIRRIVREVNPRWLFFENVAAHLTRGFARIRRELQEDGYKVEAGIFSAEEVGAPHERARLFILAELADTPSTGFPQRRCCGQQAQSTETGTGLVTEFERYGCSTLDNSEGLTAQGLPLREKQNFARARFSGELGNSRSNGFQTGRDYHGKHVRTESSADDEQRGKISDSGRAGLQRHELEGASSQGKRTYVSATELYRGDLWPAGPGEYQHSWEEPRTVKSNVGGATYGVGQRAEQLCLLGNGVVPVDAALAFVALWGRMRSND